MLSRFRLTSLGLADSTPVDKRRSSYNIVSGGAEGVCASWPRNGFHRFLRAPAPGSGPGCPPLLSGPGPDPLAAPMPAWQLWRGERLGLTSRARLPARGTQTLLSARRHLSRSSRAPLTPSRRARSGTKAQPRTACVSRPQSAGVRQPLPYRARARAMRASPAQRHELLLGAGRGTDDPYLHATASQFSFSVSSPAAVEFPTDSPIRIMTTWFRCRSRLNRCREDDIAAVCLGRLDREPVDTCVLYWWLGRIVRSWDQAITAIPWMSVPTKRA